MALRTVIADIETTRVEESFGVMQIPKTVHMLAMKELETGEVSVAVGHEQINNAVRALEEAETVIFHNGIGFDALVLEQHFGFKRNKTEMWDTLVLSRMFHADIKNLLDFDLFRQDEKLPDNDVFKFTGNLIGRHSLEAWGLRLNPKCPKGTYAEDMEAQGLDPWIEYNESMHIYGVQDVNVLARVWKEKIYPHIRPEVIDAMRTEHYLAELMIEVKNNGIKFDVARAEKLVAELQVREHEVKGDIGKRFPPRFEPQKWEYKPLNSNFYTTLMMDHPTNKIYRPYFNMPQDYRREMWGEITYSKRGRMVREGKVDLYPVDAYEATEDGSIGSGAFTKCHWNEFNPGSRPQIMRRLLELGWNPVEFTDAENPSTDADELAKIEDDLPAAKSIITYLTIQKRLGQIATGEKAWLHLVDDNGFIHPTIIPCNAVTSRATHADPNVSQVPAVKMQKVCTGMDEQGKKIYKLKANPKSFDDYVIEIAWGEAGGWGADCRACFTVPDGFDMVGCDLEGIELRCWGHYLAEFDGGKLIKTITTPGADIHEDNRRILRFDNRTDAKRFLFALMYGAGDEKLGYIIEPTSAASRQKIVGRNAKARFMNGVEGYNQLIGKLNRDAKHGYLIALDGRRLSVRKAHAALNTLLQSAGAIVSKRWIIESIRLIEEELGLKMGYENDYSLMIYSHDELQFAVRKQHAEQVKKLLEQAAVTAGEQLNMKIPIAAKGIIGGNWCDTH